MLKVEEVKVGHRYLFLDRHVDGDIPFEAVLEEISPSVEDLEHSIKQS